VYKFVYFQDCQDCPKCVGKNLILFWFVLYIILHTYLLAPWSRVLLEKLTGSQLVKKFPHLWNPQFHYSIHKYLPTVPLLSPYQWINPGLRHQFIFHNVTFFMVRNCWNLTQPLSCSSTPCRQSATAFSIYSDPHSILKAVRPSATWGRAMLWWRGPT